MKFAPQGYREQQTKETRAKSSNGSTSETYYNGKKEGEVADFDKKNYDYRYDPETKYYRIFDKNQGDFVHKLASKEKDAEPEIRKMINSTNPNIGENRDDSKESMRFMDNSEREQEKPSLDDDVDFLGQLAKKYRR